MSSPAVADPGLSARPAEVRQTPSPVAPVVGPRLRQVLDAPVAGVTWRGVSLHEALVRAGEAFSVSILRDRRIDPTRPVELERSSVPLREVLAEVASRAGGETRLVGNVVYLGPPDDAAVIRTLVESRRQELEAVRDRRLADRRVALLRGRTVRWGDLTEPAEALRLVNEEFGLGVENSEALPHDLWPGMVFSELAAPEALTLLLLQFDLTFAWSEDLASIRLVPLPERATIAIERSYRTREPADATVAGWREHFPDLDVKSEAGSIVVRTTVERHEEIDRLAAGTRGPRRPSEPRPAEIVPLDRRRFTLSVARVPIKAVMAKLEESGIRFEYDAVGFAAAGINLETPVTLDVREADADAFFRLLFSNLPVAFERDANTVRLWPSTATRRGP